MSAEATQISVNFGRPFPLFPLDGVSLMPHALLRLFIFEPRYRQMVEDVLDASGQIAMAVFQGDAWMGEYDGSPPILPAVCIGQIARHEKMADGTYHVWLHGVCRAKVVSEDGPDEMRLYRQAMLTPIDVGDVDEAALETDRAKVLQLLDAAPLNELPRVRHVLDELKSQELPTTALLDAVTLAVLATLGEKSLQYRLLEEGDPKVRASLIERELASLAGLLTRVHRQFDPEAPKGISWN